MTAKFKAADRTTVKIHFDEMVDVTVNVIVVVSVFGLNHDTNPILDI